MTTRLLPPQCASCARLAFPGPADTGHTCTAFPTGIPEQIWDNQVDHRQPYQGDNGQQWTPMVPGVEFPEWAMGGD